MPPALTLLAPLAPLYVLWGVWAASWLLAGLTAAPAARRPRSASERVAVVLVYVGFGLLFIPVADRPLWTLNGWTYWALVGLTVAAMGFCWWARRHLGALWSFRTTAKEGHHVVDTGPYALVRHPIYTGILAGALATAIVFSHPINLLGVAVLAAAFWLKAAVEERFLSEALGADAYAAYARRVRRLIPYIL